jgi:hydrogenase nickel incorporation protein HypA/HybF
MCSKNEEEFMHEMGIVQSIMEILEQQVQAHNAKKVVAVNLEFGALAGVLPEAIEFAFEILSKDTVAEGAILGITVIPIKIHCFECGKDSVLEVFDPFCPFCSSATVAIIQGREMRISSLEVEDSP